MGGGHVRTHPHHRHAQGCTLKAARGAVQRSGERHLLKVDRGEGGEARDANLEDDASVLEEGLDVLVAGVDGRAQRQLPQPVPHLRHGQVP